MSAITSTARSAMSHRLAREFAITRAQLMLCQLLEVARHLDRVRSDPDEVGIELVHEVSATLRDLLANGVPGLHEQLRDVIGTRGEP